MNSACLPALQLMTSQALSFKVSGSEHSPSVLSKGGTGRAAISRAETQCGLSPTLHASSDRTQNKCLPSTSSIGAEANEGRTVRQRLPWGIGKTADTKCEWHKGGTPRQPPPSPAVSDSWHALSLLSRATILFTHIPASLTSVIPQSA